MILDFPCEERDRLFFNGYQSWTMSHEVAPGDTPHTTHPLIHAIGKPWGTKRYGDYFFLRNPSQQDRVPGSFHGFTYMYRRRGAKYVLLGSTDETNGYTIFYYDAWMGRLRIVKDAGFTDDCDKEIHLVCFEGTEDEVFDAWFAASGIRCRDARPLAGYSSWYNRYSRITDHTITADLNGCAKVLRPGDLFQIDDGWQNSTGDWEAHPAKFPRGMKASVDDIHDKGFLAGLWLAPFSASSVSSLIRQHPGWLLRHDGKPWYGGFNWNGFFALDIDHPEVREHLRKVFHRVFHEWGFDLVKLDFLYAAAPWPTESGPYRGESRGGRMCRAMDLLHEWCGDGLILGCGVPLGPAFGKVDYCRIGCDASLDWANTPLMRQVNREIVSTRNAIGDIYYRRQLDGRAFLNDPDVFFLRDYNLQLTDAQKLLHAKICAQYGSCFLTSDSMGVYDRGQRILYEELRERWQDKSCTGLDIPAILARKF
ncbi:MAG: alpha-galactosidase [Mogibacterium sp.]|nr:alpha-galactosidase [Mogibacterium sp.]